MGERMRRWKRRRRRAPPITISHKLDDVDANGREPPQTGSSESCQLAMRGIHDLHDQEHRGEISFVTETAFAL